MALGPGCTRDLVVGDVADQHVTEGVLVLASDRRSALAADELLPLEGMQPLLRFVPFAAADGADRSEPEDLAEHRRVLEELLLFGWEPVEARGDDSLDVLGERQVFAVCLGVEPGELLRVEWVAARPREQRCLCLRRHHRTLQQAGQKARGVVVRER